MCGFAGLYKKLSLSEKDRENIKNMSKAIDYRGPDQDCIITYDNLALAFRRLSIIDLEKGSQPFCGFDGRYTAVFNGEIYNYRELRDELMKKGYTFTTNSEIEVLVTLCHEHKGDFVKLLRGMFAYVIFDKQEQKLFAARDPFGIKPFYYRENGEGIVFSSETKPFLFDDSMGGFSVDKEMLQHYLSFQYVPEPNTMSQKIKSLPAGHSMVCDFKSENAVTVEKYFDPMFCPKKEISFEDKAKLVRETVLSSVKYHMISDVDVGTFLSSGIDSAVITAAASKLNPGIKAFTVAFGVKEYSEIDAASEISKHLDVEHIKLVAGVEDFKNAFEKVVYHLDNPTADPSTVAIYLICQEAARHLKVVLSGEGSDELFGGYKVYGSAMPAARFYALPGFIKEIIYRFAMLLPDSVKGKAFIERGYTPIEKRYIGNAFIYSEKEKPSILKTYDPNVKFYSQVEDIYKACSHLSPPNKMQYVDMNTWIRGDILVKGDRLSMAHSLEVRVPFLDKEVFKVASMLCDEDKLSHGTTKYILRYAFKDMINEETFMRPKLGYPVPVYKWLKNELYDWAKDIIENSTADDYIVKEEALRMLNAHRDGSENNYRKLWTILVFITWYRLYVTDAEKTKKAIMEK
ncbi:MAG: asparagine synthase (glutamine-hydrolyzing) [Ruminococcaceae bacterium]|nr:asparagine synthase (glutamine-hydrolyzing) [Oscillospiraceae bacterium]